MLYLNNVKSDIAIMLQWLSCPPATTFTSCQYCAVCIQKFMRRTLYPICLLGTNFRTWILHQIISLPSLPYPYNGADATACVCFTSIRHEYVHTNQIYTGLSASSMTGVVFMRRFSKFFRDRAFTLKRGAGVCLL